jgi:hypothetical protein
MNPLTPLDGVTDTIIYMTIVVGMGEITEKNAAEFFARVELIQKLEGPTMVGPDGPCNLTLDDIEKRIGLHTNVAMDTWRQFSTRVMTNWHHKMVKRRNNAQKAVMR